MSQADHIFQELTAGDFNKIRSLAERQEFKEGQLIFSEGDTADYIYFIESGRISISVQKFTAREEIGMLGPGEYFGEMAFFYKDKRTASATALTDSTVLRVGKNVFLELINSDAAVASKVKKLSRGETKSFF